MTCLDSHTAGLALTMVSSAIEQLRDCWCSLGWDDSIFLSSHQLRGNLAGLRPAQRRELLITVLGLCEEPQRCRELQLVLERGQIDPAAAPSLLRAVATLQPALALKLPALHVYEKSHSPHGCNEEALRESQHDIALLGMSLRMENSLRRNGHHQLSDLIGLDEEQVLGLRGVGSNGLQELRDGLERLQLPFPLTAPAAELFTPQRAFDLFMPPQPGGPLTPPPASPFDDAIAAHFPFSVDRWSSQPEQPCFEEVQEDQQWLERASVLIGGASAELPGAQRMLEELASLTVEHFSGLGHRRRELQQLRCIFIDIAAIGSGAANRQLAAEGLQAVLLQAYSDQFHSVSRAQRWLQDLQRAIEAEGALEWFLRLAAGDTLQTIAEQLSPPISREAVRQRFRRLAECAGLTPRELAARLAGRREQQERQRLIDALRPWLQTLGRLPFHTDPGDAIIGESTSASISAGEAVTALNLNQRLDLYTSLALEVPEAEWELHLRVIANADQDAGIGYWHREDAIAEFLHRYAVVLGAPGLMPKQLQLPTAVKGAVQRLGGQGAVAAKVGLTYQGQLVGDNGRTYWTEERLRALLEQTAAHSSLATAAMPSRAQITAFLASGVVPEYLNKQPNSVFAALTRQGSLRWAQVAERFGMV
jgi:hypothetical protein